MRQNLRPTDFLLALRNAKAFEKEAIRQAVMSAAGVPSGDPARESKEEYLDILQAMGYTFRQGGNTPDVVYRQEELLLFKPDFRECVVPSNSLNYSRAELDDQMDTIRDYLSSTGFANMFCRVVLTNDPVGVIESQYEKKDDDLLKPLAWYYRLAEFRSLPDHPPGCLYFWGPSRFPILFVSPPASDPEIDITGVLKMRVLHEVIHYIVKFTLLLDGQYPLSEAIMELAGKDIAFFIMDYIEECFAHAETARILGVSYFRHVPQVQETIPKLSPADKGLGELGDWLRARAQSFYRYSVFGCLSPWAWAAEHHAELQVKDKLISHFSYPYTSYARLHFALKEHMTDIYEHAQLLPEAVFRMVTSLQAEFAEFACVVSGNSFNIFLDEYSDHPILERLFTTEKEPR